MSSKRFCDVCGCEVGIVPALLTRCTSERDVTIYLADVCNACLKTIKDYIEVLRRTAKEE